MPLAVWTAAQIISQLDSTHHWSGSTITFSSSSTPGLIAYDTDTTSIDFGLEKATYTALNATQAAAATLAINLRGRQYQRTHHHGKRRQHVNHHWRRLYPIGWFDASPTASS